VGKYFPKIYGQTNRQIRHNTSFPTTILGGEGRGYGKGHKIGCAAVMMISPSVDYVVVFELSHWTNKGKWERGVRTISEREMDPNCPPLPSFLARYLSLLKRKVENNKCQSFSKKNSGKIFAFSRQGFSPFII
jgi:hypothetical protein